MGSTNSAQAFRLLPSVEEALHDPNVLALAAPLSRAVLVELVREVLEGWRAEIKSGALDAEHLQERIAKGALARAVQERADLEQRSGVVRAINATGVVMHTGLGRAPLHPEVTRAMADATGYCVLEVDRESGERNERDARLSTLLRRLTGAEAAIAVNNNAAAVYLLLNTHLQRGVRDEVIVSRGELVEIGGSFRVPDVMERAGVVLREVGTTNRTRVADYANAIGARTALLMKIHTSNYRVEGFTEEVAPHELAELGREHKLPTAFDLGSGLLDLDGLAPWPGAMDDEPRLRAAVASGVDVVTFSGDKLLGAPQAGLLVGKRAAITALRKNPVYRALRLDKVTLAGLEATLSLYLAGRGAELPARQLVCESADQIRPRAAALAEAIDKRLGYRVEALAGHSQPGSGAAPTVLLPTVVVRVRHATLSSNALALALRRSTPPIFTRIQDDFVVFDPRTLLPGDELEVAVALARIGASSR